MRLLLSIRRRPALIAAGVLALAVLVFHWRGLRPGYAFLPIDNLNNSLPWRQGPFLLGHLQNPTIGDPIYQFYPFLVHQLNSLRAGEWPLWTDRLMLGHPLFGDPLAQSFYPAFLGLGLVFGPARGLTLGFALHALVGGVLTVGWLRVLGRGWPAAVLGGLVYALGGYFVTFFEDTFWVATLAWLPGVFWGYEHALRRRRPGALLPAVLALGLATLAGQVAFLLVFGLGLGLYALAHTLSPARRSPGPDLWPLAAAGLVLLLGTLLGAVQLLPLVEALAQSHRAQGNTFTPLPWHQLITWLVPDFYGNPATTRVYWGAYNFPEGVLYAGLVTLLLAVLSVIVERRWRTYFFFGFGLILLYCAVGGPGVRVLAGLPVARYVAVHRVVFLLPLCLAYLAGGALDAARLPLRWVVAVGTALAAAVALAVSADWGQAQVHLAELTRPLWIAGLVLAAGLLLLVVRWRWARARPAVDWAIVALVFIDLYLAGSRFNPALPIAALPGATPAIEQLQALSPPYRVATLQESGEIIFGPNYLSVYGVADLSGYSSLLPARLQRLVQAGDPASQGYNANTLWLGQPSLRLLDLLQAGWVVSRRPPADLGLRTERLAGECAAATAELTQAAPLSGTLRVHQTAINRLDLSFQVAGTPPVGQLTVRMWQGADRARLMLESQAALEQVADRLPLTFFFAPEKEAPGQVYAWEVSTDQPATGLRLCREADGEAALGLHGAEWQVAYQGEVVLTERLAPLPRASVVYAAETISDEAAALARVLDPSFDLRNVAVVAHDLGLPAKPDRPASRATLAEYGPHRVVIHAVAEAPGLLLLGDLDYPGWQAWVDGAPAPIVAANYLWRGVPLPAGSHAVVFALRPRSLIDGLVLSTLALLGLAVLAVWDWRARRQPPG